MATKIKTAKAETNSLTVSDKPAAKSISKNPVRVAGTTETTNSKSATKIVYKATDIKAIDLATAEKNILAIRQTGTKLRRLAHVTACGILLHWQEHGDWTKLINLASAIGDTMSKRMQTGFYEWVEAFSSLKYNKEKGRFDNVAKDGQKLFNLTGIADAPADSLALKGALNQAFYDGTFGDRPAHSFNFEDALKTFLERVEREMKRKIEADKREAKRIVVDHEQVKRLEVFAKSMGVTLEEKAA